MGDDGIERRHERTIRDLSRLDADIHAWAVTILRDGKALGQRHGGQVDRLREIFQRAAERLRKEVNARLNGDDVLALCTRVDLQASFLQASFDYYAVRLEHHRADNAAALEAADELIWSCYRQLYTTPKPPLPPPLTFYAPDPSPWAIEHGKSFALAEPLGARLAELAEVPLRLLAVPRWIASEPWSLVLLLHELGHHVLREHALQSRVSDLVAAIDAARASAWRSWSEEVFADLFATAVAGRNYVAALAEVVRVAPAAMASYAPRAKYPPTVVRLELAAAFVAIRGGRPPDLGELAWSRVQPAADVSVRPWIERDLEIAGEVVRRANTDARLSPWWLTPPDDAQVSARAAPGAGQQGLDRGLDEPRQWACGLARRWLHTRQAFASERDRAAAVNADWKVVIHSAEGGARGWQQPDLDAAVDELLRMGLAAEGA